jgi:TP901 family phage tail tape measure protein
MPAASVIVKVGADIDDAIRGLSRVDREVESFGGKAAKVLGGAVGIAAAAGATALVGFGASAVRVAADYETTMNRFASVAGDSIAEAGLSMQQFNTLALEMGAKTQFSAGQAADAMVELAKGGMAPATIAAGGLEATLGLAAAGELALADAAGITAKQLGVWSEQGVTAANVADLMAQAANASTVDVGELALGMANVGGVAKVAGLSFEETVQAMAQLSPGFSSAADAGTSFKTFLSSLIPTSKPAIEAMLDLGLASKDSAGNVQSAFYDASGSFIGMEKAAALLQEKTGDLTEAQRIQALETIFGSDAIRAAAIIAEGGADAFNAMGVSMEGAGTASEQAAKRNQGFAFAMDALKGSIETVQIVLGTMLLPLLTSLVTDHLTPAINAVLSFATAFSEAPNNIAFLTEAINGVIPGFSGLVSVVQTLGSFIADNIQPILVGLGTILASVLVPALASAAAAATGMVVAFLPVAAPLIALGAAAAVLYEAWQTNFGGIQEIILPVIDAVKTGFGEGGIGGALSALMGQLGTVGPQLAGWFGEVATTIGTMVGEWGQALIGWIAPTVGPFLENLGTLVAAGLTWIGEQVPVLIETLAAWGSAFVGWIGPMIPVFLETLVGLGTSLVTWIGEQAAPIAAKLGEWGAAFVAWIVPATVTFLEQWPGMLSQFLDWIGGAALSIVQKLGEWAGAFISWVAPMIPPLLLALGGVAAAALIWIGETALVLVGKLVEWGAAFVSWVAPQIPPLLVKLGELAGSVIAWIGEKVPEVVAKLVEWGGAFLGWVGKDVLPTIGVKLAEIGSAVITWIGNEGPTIIAKLVEWGAAFLGFVARDVLPFIVEKLAALGSAVITWIGDEGPVIIGKLVEWGGAFLGFIAKDVIPFLSEKLGAITSSIGTWITDTAVPWALEELAAVGTAIVDGIESGISSAWEGFLSWVDEQIAKLPSAVRTALGIGSPSKVFAEIGSQIPAGLAVGILGNKGAVDSALRGLVNPERLAREIWHLRQMARDAEAAGGIEEARSILERVRHLDRQRSHQIMAADLGLDTARGLFPSGALPTPLPSPSPLPAMQMNPYPYRTEVDRNEPRTIHYHYSPTINTNAREVKHEFGYHQMRAMSIAG